MKKLLSLALTLLLSLGLSVPSSASDMGVVGSYTTVSTGSVITAAIKI